MPSRALICAVLSVSAVNLGRMAGSNNKAYQITYPNAGLDPMGNSRAILRTAARANGWRVSIDSDPESSDTYLLPGEPARKIEVWWGGPGNVRMAALYDGGFISRYDDHSTKAQRVLSVLSGRTDDFPPHRPNDLAVGYNLTASHLLRTVPMVEMGWYARPEGDRHQLRLAPRLASWNKADDADQLRLRAYLDDTEALLAGSRLDGPWALRLDVGLPPKRDLLNMADLDNYAYPLAHRLNDPGLVSVWCTKQHAEQSFVRIEPARERPSPSADVLVVGTTESASTLAYKEQVYAAVAGTSGLPAGQVRLELAFVVGPSRKWLNLWKQTIDSLSPLLGCANPEQAWHPLDGRITELGMHVKVDPALRNDVVIGIAATPA